MTTETTEQATTTANVRTKLGAKVHRTYRVDDASGTTIGSWTACGKRARGAMAVTTAAVDCKVCAR